MTDLPVLPLRRLAAGLLGALLFGFVLAQTPHLVHHLATGDDEHEVECPFALVADRLSMVLVEPTPPPVIWLVRPAVSIGPVATVRCLDVAPRPSRAPLPAHPSSIA